jgi:predicted GNAT family N-acyltransferase
LIEVREARGDAERDAALALRRDVFVDEQGVPEELEIDEHDEAALHLVAFDGDRLVGVCRLVMGTPPTPRAKFGRLVVARDARGAGIGSALLGEAERRAHALGAQRMVLTAQTAAVGLYERAGYTARGDVFLDAGIEHVTMEKALA